MATPEADLTRSSELLNSELPDPRFDDGENRYLSWLYDENPSGPAYQGSTDGDADGDGGGDGAQGGMGVRLAHYALIPQDYRDANGPVPGVFSLNAVTRSGTQRKGHFIDLAKELYARAGADGRSLAIGVPNEKSVGAGPKHLGWRLEGQIPVKICIPTATGRGIESIAATPEFLDSPGFVAIASDLDDSPTTHITNSWNVDRLRWRLARPHAEHVVHVGPDVVGVSLRTVQRGVPAAVIMKLLPRAGRTGSLSSRAIVAAACRYHRTPVAVHGGWNEHVKVVGFEPPKRLRPAPLFLLLKSLREGYDQDAIRLSTYEFLDMDAF